MENIIKGKQLSAVKSLEGTESSNVVLILLQLNTRPSIEERSALGKPEILR